MRTALGAAFFLGVIACGKPAAETTSPPDDGHGAPATAADPMAVYEALEARIEAGQASDKDRQAALDEVGAIADDGTAEYAFARAAITGRVAELRGVKAGKLVTQAESWAKTSMERNPEFRDRAATRMLGTLWVMAPPRLLEHGDSEQGLELLEGLAESAPDIVENNLRVAEAYVFLGDPDPAVPYLCRVKAQADGRRADDGKLYERLVAEVAGGQELACEAVDD